MSTRNLFFAMAAALVLLGCGRSAAPAEEAMAQVQRTVTEVAIAVGEPVAIADLSIEGMSCEMACGSAIRKALAKLGVAGTEIMMSETEGPDHAVVTYDASKVSDEQMVSAIHTIHDGQFKVVAVSITKQVKQGANGKADPAKAEKEDGVQVYSPREVVLPSVLAILSRILRM
ncbi:MAG: heavy-metal-associated domain-containing protein [Flavobacteriales bacterium]|nr:heavy-metal-associated domain-containing protein [Flavobacteriales bacterium]